MTMKIAFLGLGAMGGRMAANLMKAGHDLTVWNRSADRAGPLVAVGAKLAGTPKAAAMGADIVIAMVRDDAASAEIWQNPESGAFAGMRAEAIAVESSTLTVAHIRQLAEAAEARGLRFLDVPLAGSRPQAEAGQLIFLAGGEAETLAEAQTALLAMGGAIHHAGGVGAGAAVKLAVNALFGIQVAALAEVMGLLAANGVNGAKAAEIIGATPVASPAANAAVASMLAGAFAPMFPVELVEKDFAYVQAATPTGTPMSDAARGVMQRAMAAGLGNQNLTGIVRLYQP
jgi:3-hydroxyisobutyrate dehydrogenase